MKIAVAYNRVDALAPEDEQDVLVEVRTVMQSLEGLSHTTLSLPCSLNLAEAKERLGDFKPDLVFNLVESLDGRGRLISLFPDLLDAMNLAYTGSCAAAITTTSNKVLAKERMVAAGLPTAPWVGPCPGQPSCVAGIPGNEPMTIPCDWIVKSLWEHASVGLEADGILRGLTRAGAAAKLPGRAKALGGACFAERLIEGREFNISLLDAAGGPRVLPPAEIVFDGFTDPGERILGYRAKWDKDSFEYQHTNRTFDFPAADRALLERLKDLSVRCWHAFGLGGYARVDFRVDADGNPFILEVNANPCLSPDAGFAAAVLQAGIPQDRAIEQILAAACPSRGGAPGTDETFAFRQEVLARDAEDVGRLVAATGFFSEAEVGVACELVEERLTRGEESGYHFIMADDPAGHLAGYVCYGPIPCTVSNFDLYWIAVRPDLQGAGLGRTLLNRAEQEICRKGGTAVYVETSMHPRYGGTRAFYERSGYDLEGLFKDFYGPSDDKAVYCKRIFL